MVRAVTLVTGPPCAGKNTWVDQRREPGDLMVDFDAAAIRLGSPAQWGHPRHIREQAGQWVNATLARLATQQDVTAWVIRCVPDASQRTALARWLGAQVVVLLPPTPVLYQRAGHRPDPATTRRAIGKWLRRYRPAPCDQLLTDAGSLAVTSERW